MNRFIEAVAVEDYHDFKYICQSFITRKFKHIELAYIDGRGYVGIIFEGPRPSKEEQEACLAKAGIQYDVVP